MITLIIVMLSWTAFSQATTKGVKVNTLKAMAKDLEKCHKVIVPELDLKSAKLDSLVIENLTIFTELKLLRTENKSYDKRLEELNQDLLKAEKTKKRSWVFPTAAFVLGVLVGASF